MVIHTAFDLLAAVASFGVTAFCFWWWLSDAAALIGGAAAGGYGFGTLNRQLSGEMMVARSIGGALEGAIVAIEVFKRVNGLRGSTGLIFVPAFATTVVVGRWGCFLAGL